MRAATWWTPGGYQRQEMPKAYAEAREKSMETGELWSLDVIGYKQFDKVGTDDDEYCVTTYRAGNGHHLVNFSNYSFGLSEIFVSEAHADEFYITEYMRIVGQMKAMTGADHTAKLIRVITAFVRHGGGIHTVSEDGEITKDEARRRRDGAEQAQGIAGS